MLAQMYATASIFTCVSSGMILCPRSIESFVYVMYFCLIKNLQVSIELNAYLGGCVKCWLNVFKRQQNVSVII